MDYEIHGTHLDFYRSDQYGAIPNDFLASKFEQTDMGDEEDKYDDFARGQLTDWRPDQAQFAYEDPRGRVNQQAGRLQLQYYGHRGNEDDPAHPEIFTGFAGADNMDPRGVAIDPDFREFVKQEQARMGYIRFSKDDSKFMIDGHRAERKEIQDMQTLHKWVRNNLKVFSRQRDGRRNGMMKIFKDTARLSRNISEQSKYTGDTSDDVQIHKTNIIKQYGKNIRDSREFRDNAEDYDRDESAPMKYGQVRSSRGNARGDSILESTDVDTDHTEGMQTKQFRAVSKLMSTIVNSRHMLLDGDTDDHTTESLVVKQAAGVRDLTHLLRNTRVDGDLESSEETMITTTAPLRRQQHLARTTETFIQPELHKASKVFKTVAGSKDNIGVKFGSKGDHSATTLEDMRTVLSKSVGESGDHISLRWGANRDSETAEDFAVVNYRAAANKSKRNQRTQSGENFKKESDLTIKGRTLHTNYRNPEIADTEQMMVYGKNDQGDRQGGSTGRLGNKALSRRSSQREDGSSGGYVAD